MDSMVMTPNTGNSKTARFFASGISSPNQNKIQDQQELSSDYIIHRSGAAVITNNYQQDQKRKLQREIDLKTKGWFSKEQVPYQQLGDFSNILQGIESVKNNLPHTKQNFDDLTLKQLKFMKKVYNPNQMKLEEPGRTVKILRQYQGQINKMRAQSQADNEANQMNKYSNNPQHQRGQSENQGKKGGIFGNDTNEEELKQRQLAVLRYQNAFINSPSMVKLVATSIDGRQVLKSEIAGSNQRVLQIKHGMPINQVLYPPVTTENPMSSIIDISVIGTDRITENQSSMRKVSPIKNDQNKSTESSIPSFKIRKQSKYQLSNLNGKYTVRSSLTQPLSPVAEKSLSPKVTIPLPNGGNTVFNPDNVIYIPNFHSNKQPKIIKMSNLAQVVKSKDIAGSQASSTNSNYDMTTSHRGGQSVLDNINSRRVLNERNYNSSLNNYQGDRPSGNNGSSLSVWNQNAKKAGGTNKDQGGVNYHKKLKDEFDRFEKFMREQHIAEGYISGQPVNTRQSHIRQMIANSFLNVSFASSIQKRQSMDPTTATTGGDIDSLNSGRISGLSQELHAELGTFQVSRARQANYQGMSGTKNRTEQVGEGNDSNTRKIKNQQLSSMMTNIGNKVKEQLSQQNQQQKPIPHHSQIVGEHLKTSMQAQHGGHLRKHRLSRFERDQLLITAIINSIKGPIDSNAQEEEELLRKVSDDYLWKECNTLLKDYFHFDFLNELKDNKQLMFRLYKLYLLHQLLMRMKAIEDNPNGQKKQKGNNKSSITNHSKSLLAAAPLQGEPPLVYEEYSDDEIDPNNPDPHGEEAEQRKYRGMDKDEIYKHKIKSFIHLLQDLLNPAEIPEARELDSVFQIKAQVRSYYERKGELSDNLTQTLYAMMQERTSIIESKKKYFFRSYEKSPTKTTGENGESLENTSSNMKKIKNLYFELEQMRANSEKDRIKTYREMLEALLAQANSSVIKKY